MVLLKCMKIVGCLMVMEGGVLLLEKAGTFPAYGIVYFFNGLGLVVTGLFGIIWIVNKKGG